MVEMPPISYDARNSAGGSQAEPEPTQPPELLVTIERADIGIQHDFIESPKSSVKTDPITEQCVSCHATCPTLHPFGS